MSARFPAMCGIRSVFTASMALISPNNQNYAKMPDKIGLGRQSGLIPDRRIWTCDMFRFSSGA